MFILMVKKLTNMDTIKINNIEVSKDELRKIISENPDLLKPVANKGRYFFPKHDDTFWSFNQKGEVFNGLYGTYNTYDTFNKNTIEKYATEAEAIHARDRKQAIVRCWKWAQENAPFEPDWSDNNEYQYFASLDTVDNTLSAVSFSSKFQNELPYFKSREDAKKFIEANKEDLLLIFK